MWDVESNVFANTCNFFAYSRPFFLGYAEQGRAVVLPQGLKAREFGKRGKRDRVGRRGGNIDKLGAKRCGRGADASRSLIFG